MALSPLGLCCSILLLAGHRAAAQQLSDVPAESTVSARPHGHHRYHVLHNVLLTDSSLLFYVPDELADMPPDDAHTAPTQQQLKVEGAWWDPDMDSFRVEIVSKHNATRFPQTCQHWVEQPAVMYSGMGGDSINFFHFFIDSFGLIFNTVAGLNLFDVDALASRNAAPSREQANLVLIQRRPRSWHNVYGLHMLYNFITPDQWTFPQGAGACYRTLVVGLNSHLSAYNSALDAEDQAQKIAEQARLVRFITIAQAHIDAKRGIDIDALKQVYEPQRQKLAIGFISRPGGKWNSRAVLNEQELVEAMQQRYSSATVSMLKFSSRMSTSESIMAVSSLHVLIGAHGAGLTNLLWLRPGMSVIQLIPYGWRQRNGRLIGMDMFERLAVNANCSHFMWENTHANMSWLNKGFGGEEHPSPELAQTFSHLEPAEGEVFNSFQYQDTTVELQSFLAVVDDAVRAASHDLMSAPIK